MLFTFFSCALSDVAARKLGEDGSVALARPAVETRRSWLAVSEQAGQSLRDREPNWRRPHSGRKRPEERGLGAGELAAN
jgi:hypothetical protein